MQNPVLILLVGHGESDARLLKSLLPQIGSLYRLECSASLDLTTVQLEKYEIFLVDSQSLVEEIVPQVSPAPVILLTDEAQLGAAALEAGAADYLERSQFSAPLLEKSLRLTLTCAQIKCQQQTKGNHKLYSSLDTLPICISYTDAQQRYQFVNKNYEHWFGLKLEQIQGKRLPEVLGEQAYETVKDFVEKALAGEEVVYEAEVPYQWGGKRHILGTLIPDREANRVRGYYALIHDVTESRQAKAFLKQQKELLQSIFDHIPVMIAFFNANGRVELINQELERVIGWSLAEWQQRNLLEECYPNPAYLQQVIDHMQAATRQQKDLKTRVRDGRVIDTSWTNVRLSDGTGISIGQDISDRKRSEEQLRARLALETALAKISRLLATNEAADLSYVLKLLNDAVETNRAFLLQFRQGMRADVTHEWYDSDSQSIAEQFQDLDMSQFPWWLSQLKSNQNITIPDVEAMPESAQLEQSILKSIDVHSLIAVPIFDSASQLWGSIGFHITCQGDRQWSAEDAQLLRTAGDAIYSYCLRIQTQNQLRASEALYAGIFNHSAEMMLLLRVLPNNEFAYETVNPAYTRLTSITHDQVVGKTLTQLWPPEIAAYFTSRCQECLAAGQPISFEEVFKHPRGSRICYTTLVPIRDTTGQVIRILGSARDITEEKQAIAEQIRLTQYQRLLASIVLKIRQSWSIQEILQTAVTEIQKTLQVERVVFYRILPDGSSKALTEAVVPPFGSVQDQVFPAQYCLEGVKKAYQQRKVLSCPDIYDTALSAEDIKFLEQYQMRGYLKIPIFLKQPQATPENPTFFISASGEPIWGVLGIYQCSEPRAWTADETELLTQLAMQLSIALEHAQLREQETRQRQELARSNAELADFAYVASHDLQAPLQTIANYAKLLERRYQNQLDDKANRYIHYIVSGAQRLQTQIKDLLKYARVNSQIKPLTPTNLNDVLEQAIANLGLVIEHNQAAVSVGILPTVMADGSQLVQLFQNLISNAIKYRSQDPPVVCIEAKRQEKYWVISVSDNGIGINPKYFDRIFQVFQRLHTQEEYPGNGIGLSICKKIVERHNGRIWVNSSPDNGSQFFVALLN